jgi:hypothetical protein
MIIADKGWQRRFDEPIELQLRTLKEAIAWAGESDTEIRAHDAEGPGCRPHGDRGCRKQRSDDLRADGNVASDQPSSSQRVRHLAEAASLGKTKAQEGRMTVLIYVNTNKQVGDPDHLKVFANNDAAETWLQENDPEGVAFEYEVLE